MQNAKPTVATEVDHNALKTSLAQQLPKVFKRGSYTVPKIITNLDTKEAEQQRIQMQKAINKY